MRIPKGVSLVDFVMIIAVLGVLAAVAVPRFIDLQVNAQQAAVDGVAGSLAAASSINHVGCSTVSNEVIVGKCMTVAKCSDVAASITPALTLGIAGIAIADTYNLAADTTATGNGTEVSCTLQISKDGTAYTATYTVTGAGQ